MTSSFLPARRPACLPLAAPFALCAALLAPLAHAASPAGGAGSRDPLPSYKMKAGEMQCSDHLRMNVQADGPADSRIRLTWHGRHYIMRRQPTTTGAYHFDDVKAGLVMIQIPAKSMLFDSRHMMRLADDCNPGSATRVASRR